MLKKTYVLVSGLIFFTIAIVHFFRMMFQVNAFVGTWAVPNWVSGTAVIVGLFMSFIAFKIIREKKPKTEVSEKKEDKLENNKSESDSGDFEKPEQLPRV